MSKNRVNACPIRVTKAISILKNKVMGSSIWEEKKNEKKGRTIWGKDYLMFD
jgi:hypothetical protein